MPLKSISLILCLGSLIASAELPVPDVLLVHTNVALELLPMTGKSQVEVGVGTQDHNEQNIVVQHLATDQIGLGAFAGRESANGIDYDDNDMDRATAGGQLQYREDNTQVDLLAAHQKKEFGARGYYGLDDSLAANEETEDSLLHLAATRGDLNNDYLRGGLQWREVQDDYFIPFWLYESRTRSRANSAFFDGRTLEINQWAVGWRTDIEEESVAGSVLGTHHRTHGGLSLLPEWRGDRLKLSAGLRSEFYTGESPHVLPQTGAEFLISDNLTAFATYNETVRLPSYTELYENSPASLGNAGLEPQIARQTELGLKGIPSEFIDWKLAAFHRRTKNTIDWIKATPGGRWNATDIGDLDLYGTEARIGWYPSEQLEAKLSYIWMIQDRDADDMNAYASRSALDYPEHLVQASLLWHPLQPLEIGTEQTLRWQTDNAVRTGSDFGADGSFVIRFTPPKADYATLSLFLNNVWDSDFQPFPGQHPAKRFAGVSLTLTW